MSIIRAIARAYKVAKERNWDKIYWALDLHGTCMRGTYVQGEYDWEPGAKEALEYIASLPETVLILWSSLHDHEVEAVIEFFKDSGITPHYFNSNPLVGDTKTGCFQDKFYFSVLVDDKAGFSPADWPTVKQAVSDLRSVYELNS